VDARACVMDASVENMADSQRLVGSQQVDVA
jgi:hypothetical protein